MSKVTEKTGNVHFIEARHLPPTNCKGSRVKLTSYRFERDSITDGFDYEHNGTLSQAKAMLAKLGYTLAGAGESPRGYILAVSEFKPLRDSLAEFKAGGAA